MKSILKIVLELVYFRKTGILLKLLIKNADTAMYKSKEISGNSYHFYKAGMDTRTFESVKLKMLYIKLWINDELVIYYQPQINYKTKMLSLVWKLY